MREFSKNNGTFPLGLCFKPDLEKILLLHVDRCKYCQLSSTDDHRRFITWSVHLCVHHDVQDAAARRTGPSAASETKGIRRILVKGVDALLPPEAEKIVKI